MTSPVLNALTSPPHPLCPPPLPTTAAYVASLKAASLMARATVSRGCVCVCVCVCVCGCVCGRGDGVWVWVWACVWMCVCRSEALRLCVSRC